MSHTSIAEIQQTNPSSTGDSLNNFLATSSLLILDDIINSVGLFCSETNLSICSHKDFVCSSANLLKSTKLQSF